MSSDAVFGFAGVLLDGSGLRRSPGAPRRGRC